MQDYDVAVIGTGADPENTSTDGYAMAYHHADGFERLENCAIVACADIVRENAEAFAETYDVPGVYEDHQEMLDDADPDVVSIAVPPAAHADLVIDCTLADSVDAIHCEKPMDQTWGGARLMAQEASRRDVNLTFNHQRRFGNPFRRAKELLDAEEIGELRRVEFAASALFDYGTHSIDLCNYFNDERSAEWVLAGLDYAETNVLFGTHNANEVIVHWEYDNGVSGVGATGDRPSAGIDCHNRLIGTEGTIEIGPVEADATLRVRRDGAGWETVDTGGEGLHEWEYVHRAVEDVVRGLDEGRESELCARNALNATEIIFAAYESVRRRGRVDLPLTVADNPLVSMVETGELAPDSPPE